jgi:hypothetical protein
MLQCVVGVKTVVNFGWEFLVQLPVLVMQFQQEADRLVGVFHRRRIGTAGGRHDAIQPQVGVIWP